MACAEHITKIATEHDVVGNNQNKRCPFYRPIGEGEERGAKKFEDVSEGKEATEIGPGPTIGYYGNEYENRLSSWRPSRCAEEIRSKRAGTSSPDGREGSWRSVARL